MKRQILLALGFCCIFVLQTRASVVINEVMQSNIYTIMDELNEFPDSWVELYNDGDMPVKMQGWRIGSDSGFASSWTMPEATIGPHSYFLLYCDKADVGIHADFRIDSGKNTLTVYDAEGNIVDEVKLKKQPAPDIAYGRVTDGASKWGYQIEATPRRANSGASDTVMPEVTFDIPGGVFTSSVNILLSMSAKGAPEGTRIIYTIDGREPQEGQCAVYTSPIAITRSTTVRAKAICDGCVSRPSTSQSYIVTDHEMEVPLIAFSIPDRYLYDKYIGIFADGTGGEGKENYRYDWRRPANIEYFAQPGSNAVINQLCELRVQGGWTRSNPLKSLAVYANKRFGVKRFEAELWHKDKPGLTDIKSFILRNGGNDFCWTYVRDGLIQRVIGRNTDIDWQGYAPAVVYINGRYHGMLAIRERSNEDHIYTNYAGLEDIDMFENWWEIKSGDWAERDAFTAFMNTEHSYSEWAEVVDLESYFALMAINYWVYNTDFPDNNTVMWRRRAGDDRRWRWLVKDCDFGLGIWNSNENLNANFSRYMDAGDGTGFTLWRNMMKCSELRDAFVDHLVAWQGDFLNGATFDAYLDEIMDENHGELLTSHNIWRATIGWGWSDLYNNVWFMRQWISQRQSGMSRLMRNSWGLGQAVNVTVNASIDADEAEAIHLTYDGVPVHGGRWNGNDYVGRTIVLSGAPEDNIVAWRVQCGSSAEEIVEGAALTLMVDSRDDIRINAIIDHTGIADISADHTGIEVCGDRVYALGRIAVYDLQGRLAAEGFDSVTLPSAGMWIVRAASCVSKVTVR